MRRLSCFLVACLLTGCRGDVTQPYQLPSALLGTWVLSTINGKAHPAPLASNPYLPIASETLWFSDYGGVQRERLLLNASTPLPVETGIARDYLGDVGIALMFDNSNSPPFAKMHGATLDVVRGGDSLTYVRPAAR